MSEHAWVLENLATYTAGGLAPAEQERLERHTASCARCARALEEVRAVDRSLEGLFAEARPGPALEDRLIRSLREAPVYPRRWLRLAACAAAVLLLGVLGAGASELIARGELPFPGTWGANRIVAENDLKALSSEAVAANDAAKTQEAGATVFEYRRSTTGGTGAVATADSSGSMPDVDKETDRLSEELLNAIGYYPPARALVVKGTSSLHTRLGGPVDRGRPNGSMGTKAGDYAGSGSPALMADGSVRLPQSPTVTGSPTDVTSETWQAAPTPGPMSGESNIPSYYAQNGKQSSTYRNDQPAAGGGGAAAAGWQANTGKDVTKREETVSRQLSESKKNLQAVREQDERTLKELEKNIKALNGQEGQANSPRPPPDSTTLYNKAKARREALSIESLDDAENPSGPTDAKAPRQAGTSQKSGRPKGTGAPQPAAPSPRKIVIRSGEMEFEIESFDAAVAAVTKLVNAIPGGYVDTVNSEKLANGKVRGAAVVRVPPEHLDSLVLDLRKELGRMGELKGLRIGSQDITKQYTDLESRLRAARTMEERLLQIIKAGKGEIKDLLQAEKELGIWRTKIEELTGELRYYSNLVALSTLTINLYEREIRAPFAIVETERVEMGIEVEDVDRAQRQALAAVAEVKGRVERSELKQLAAGQFQALLHFEVAPEAAGPLRDRLRQLGTVSRLDINRVRQTEGGSGRPQDARSKQNDTQFFVSLYNLTALLPRETVHLNLACADVEAAYRAILARARKFTARVVTSNLNRQPGEQSAGTIQFEVKTAEADALLRELKEAGEVMRLQLTENPEGPNVTRSKRGFDVQLLSQGAAAPRETQTVKLATRDVPAGYHALQEAVAKVKGRVLNAQLNEQDRQNIEGQLSFDIRRGDEVVIEAALTRAGDIQSRTAARAPDAENVLDSKLRYQVTLVNAASIPPRETVLLGIEVANVDTTAATFAALVGEGQGRTVEAHVAHERSGRVVAKLVFDVPDRKAADLVAQFKGAGVVRIQQSSRNPQVPESNLAVARLDVTLSNAELIVPSDEGLWPQVRKGLATSFVALSWSLTVVIVGVCFVLPWALVGYAVYRLVLRLRKRPAGVGTAV